MNFLKVSPGIEEYTQSQFLINFRKTIEKYPSVDFSDSMSRNQIKSKVWLISKMINIFGLSYENIFVLCGWYGILPAMIADQKNIKFKALRSVDQDPHCLEIADSMNYENFKDKWRFKAFTEDILSLSYNPIKLSFNNKNNARINETADLIINTSCEHISNFNSWIKLLPKGQKVIFQSNNYDLHAQHTNCSDSLDEFVQQCNLSKVLFSDTLSFTDYDRYMIMGFI